MANIENSFDYPGFDYAPQRTKIARKLALSQALQKQGMEPLDTNRMSGGWAIPISPFEGLAKMAQAYVGGKLGNDVSKDQADLAKTAQGNTRAALAQALGNSGLDQKEIDSYSAAMLDPMASQAMPFLAQGMQQKRQMALARQMFPDMFPDSQTGPAQAPQGPPVGQGTVLAPGMGGVPQGPQGQPPASSWPAGAREVFGGGMIGNNGMVELGKMIHSDNQTRGGVQYDQNGKAFIINNNGSVQYLTGITARDKNDLLDTGDKITPTNPYTGVQGPSIQKGLTPAQQVEVPIAAGKYEFETGKKAPAMPNAAPVAPGQPATPLAPKVQVGPKSLPGVTPKAQAEINATRAADKPSATASLGDATNNLDRLAKEVESIMNDPALSKITGLVGKIPNAPGSKATDVEARLDAVKSQVAFAVLQAMRNASKTGGALGSVSNFEEQMLQNNLAAITNRNQSHESMKANLQKIIDYTAAAKGRLMQAYKDTYNENAPGFDPGAGAGTVKGLGNTGGLPTKWEDLK